MCLSNVSKVTSIPFTSVPTIGVSCRFFRSFERPLQTLNQQLKYELSTRNCGGERRPRQTIVPISSDTVGCSMDKGANWSR
jgi:hypothetical protein